MNTRWRKTLYICNVDSDKLKPKIWRNNYKDLQQLDKSSDIEQQPPFGEPKYNV